MMLLFLNGLDKYFHMGKQKCTNLEIVMTSCVVAFFDLSLHIRYSSIICNITTIYQTNYLNIQQLNIMIV